MEQGWVSLHRQIRDHWLWKDKPFARGQAWTDMILRANHLEAKIVIEGEVINIPEGAFFASETGLAADWGWSRKKVHGFIDVLTKEEMLETKKHRKGAVFFLINYANFRYTGTAEEPQKNRTGTAQEPHRNTNNNYNNENNVNKSLSSRKKRGKKTEINPSFDLEALAKKMEESDDVV